MHDVDSEVLIVGAGPVGLALGLGLSRAGRSVRLLDAREADAGAGDARVLALSHGSRQTLERLGAWPTEGWTAIETIHVSHQGGFGRTCLRHAEYGLPALGYVMPAATLYRSLKAAALEQGLSITHGIKVHALTPEAEQITAQLDDGGTCTAHLAACCEGHIGPEVARISRDYGQHALIARVTPAAPHGGIAYERFTAEGPLALLPLGADYSAVWTLPPERARAWVDADEAAFRAALQKAFGNRVRLTASAGRACFPLILNVRSNPVGSRTVWLGNAAQTLHPVAGQGFNLALRDVWALVNMASNSPDPGSGAALADYARARLLDRQGTIGFTDSLVRLFSNADPLLRGLRGAGLLALDLAPPLRHFVARRMVFGARAWP